MKPLLSIIVPVYNTAPFLRNCMDSLCNQTYSNLEIICIDDGSVDNSLSILMEYAEKDNRIKVFSQRNKGAAAARNKGILEATGEWVTGVDSDDFLDLDTCQYVVSHIRPEVDVISYDMKMCWQGMERDEGIDKYYDRRLDGVYKVSPEFIFDKPCEFCSKFWRNAFLKKYQCQFPNGLSYEDWYFFWAYMPHVKYILYLPLAKYNYVRRVDSNTACTLKKWPRALDYMSLASRLLDYRLACPLPNMWSAMNLLNFLYCYQCAIKYVPTDMLPEVDIRAQEITNHCLLRSWRKWLLVFTSHCSCRGFFTHYLPGKILVGCFYRYFLSFQIENDAVVLRLFGKRIYRKSFFS